MKTKLENISYIIGMPRAGTTFLYHNLNKHPDLYVPFRRKTNYFSLHKDKSIEWFLDHFKDMKENQIGIDTETLYFVDKNLQSYKNIKQINPNAKVMLFVRKPDEWVYSFYKQIATFDKDMVSFEDFLKGKYVLCEDNKSIPFNIANGDIKQIIEDIKNIFNENLLIIDFNLFKKDPLKLLQEIEIFLNISPYFTEKNFENKKINASDRGHVVLLASFLRQEWLINVLNKLPRKLVISIRGLYDKLGTLTRQKSDNLYKSHEIDLAKSFFIDDEKYVKDIFHQTPIIKKNK